MSCLWGLHTKDVVCVGLLVKKSPVGLHQVYIKQYCSNATGKGLNKFHLADGLNLQRYHLPDQAFQSQHAL